MLGPGVGENFANLSHVNAAGVAVTRIAEKQTQKKLFCDLHDYMKTTFQQSLYNHISDRLPLYYIRLVPVVISKIF